MAFEGEEDDVVNFEEEDLKEGVEECLKSLLGKVTANREINPRTLENVMKVVWGNPAEIACCYFRGGIETLQDPNSFEMAPFWVQCWGVPLHCQTLAQGSRRVLKFKAEVNISKPFRKGVWAMGPNKEKFWVEFKVERLPLLCSYCRITGHDVRFCTMASQEEEEGKKGEGDWSSESETNNAKEKITDKEGNGVEEIDGNSSDNDKAALRTSPENTQNQGYKEGSSKTSEDNTW
ncbi:hypothetical protein L6164_034062 [Bauhinia variegata]|uniref:Uncharacterized protein n=1 Tax=Bauhinia variegata TaxID=167791 RepID=A0ACB9KTR9_BAUVA|nr:hypothetical protein L6164_034062 [Bauhinia variegata]